MDFIMYACPKCRKVFKVNGNNKTVKCSKCTNSYLVDMGITLAAWNGMNQGLKEGIKDNAISQIASIGPVKESDNRKIVKTITYKCKMCGGQMEIGEKETVCTCDYCGTSQTLPKLNDERRLSMYDRANHFRRNNDYDKAMGIYEQILNEDQSDAETYWSIVLCRYGIEYVEDPATKSRIPTINRTQYTSIYDDEDYKEAINHSDPLQKSIYEKEAKAINDIQKGILAISSNEEPFDVFICYKETDDSGRRTQDSVLANDLYHQLTQEGFKVFYAKITLEDRLGQEYEPYIFAALNSAKVMIAIGTKPEYFKAVWVRNEWSRFLAQIKAGANKVLIPAYKDMDPYDLPDEFSTLQAQDMNNLGFVQDLIRGIKKIASSNTNRENNKETVILDTNTNVMPLLKRVFLFLEDGDWDNADEYCERVLDIDPENGEAYLGKLMSQLRINKREQLGQQTSLFSDNMNYKKIMRFGNEDTKREVDGYLQSITTRIEEEKKDRIFTYLKQIVEPDTVMNMAAKFGTSTKIMDDICKKMREDGEIVLIKDEERDDYVLYDNSSAYAITGFKEIKDRRQKEDAYQRGCVVLQKASTEDDYAYAASMFEMAKGFNDADNKLAICREKYEEIIYEKGCSLMEDASKEEEYSDAIRLFTKIKGYGDADRKCDICRDKIAEFEKQREEKNKHSSIFDILTKR